MKTHENTRFFIRVLPIALLLTLLAPAVSAQPFDGDMLLPMGPDGIRLMPAFSSVPEPWLGPLVPDGREGPLDALGDGRVYRLALTDESFFVGITNSEAGTTLTIERPGLDTFTIDIAAAPEASFFVLERDPAGTAFDVLRSDATTGLLEPLVGGEPGLAMGLAHREGCGDLVIGVIDQDTLTSSLEFFDDVTGAPTFSLPLGNSLVSDVDFAPRTGSRCALHALIDNGETEGVAIFDYDPLDPLAGDVFTAPLLLPTPESQPMGVSALNAIRGLVVYRTPDAAGNLGGGNYYDVGAGPWNPFFLSTDLADIGRGTHLNVEADLVVTSVASRPVVGPGESFEYVVTVTNDGPSNVGEFQLYDSNGSGGYSMAEISLGEPICSFYPGAYDFFCYWDEGLAVGESVEVVVTAVVNEWVQQDDVLANRAEIFTLDPDPNLDNNLFLLEEPTVQVPEADVAIDAYATVAEVAPGEQFEWVVTISNLGPEEALRSSMFMFPWNPVLYEPLGATIVPPDWPIEGEDPSCNVAFNNVDCLFGTMPPGESVEVRILARANADAPAGGVLRGSAFADTVSFDPNLENDEAIIEEPVIPGASGPQADVAVTNVADASVVAPGGTFTYTVTIINNGPDPAENVLLNDWPGPYLTFTKVDPPSPDCNVQTGGFGVVCNWELLAPGAEHVVTVTAEADADAPAQAQLFTDAHLFSSTDDPVLANNDATADGTTVGTPPADVRVNKFADRATVVPGETFFYTIFVTNDGPATALNVNLLDPAPDDTLMAFVSTTLESCEIELGAVSCALGDMGPGAQVVFDIETRVADGAPEGVTLVNNVAVTHDTLDPDSQNNEDSVANPVVLTEPQADLEVSKSADTNFVRVGESFVWTVTVTNAGPDAAENVVLIDTPGPYQSLVGVIPGPPWCEVQGNGTVSCNFASIPAGGSEIVTITAFVTEEAPDLETLLNHAAVSSDTDDPDSHDNEETAEGPEVLSPAADLRVQKVADVEQVEPGGTFHYIVTLTNQGPLIAEDITLSDVAFGTEALMTFLSVTPSECGLVAGNVVDCSFDSLLVGESRTMEITVRVADDAPEGTTLVNSALVESETVDFEPINDFVEIDYPVVHTPIADLSVEKSVSTSQVTVEDPFTYTVTVSNAGPDDAEDVVLIDVPSPYAELLSSLPGPPDCTIAAGSASCSLGTIPAGQTRTVLFTAIAPADTPNFQDLHNEASVSAATDDPNSTNDQTLVEGPTAFQPNADVGLTKIADVERIEPGGTFHYILTVTNHGPEVAEGVLVSDVAFGSEALMTFLSVTPSECELVAGNVVDCNFETLGVDGTRTIEITVRVAEDAPEETSLVNSALVVETATTDINSSNDFIEIDYPMVRSALADLSVQKSASVSEAFAGDTFLYTVVVVNDGPGAAENVELTDSLGSYMVFTGSQPASPTCTIEAVGESVSCSLGTIPAGGSQTVILTARVDEDAPRLAQLVNSAQVTSDTPDPEPLNNETAITGPTVLVRGADLEIVKSSPYDVADLNGEVFYDLTVTNHGPDDASVLTVRDIPVSAGLILIDASHSNCAIDADNSATCLFGALPVGESIQVRVEALVDCEGLESEYLLNGATVSAATYDPDPSNNEFVYGGPRAPLADLRITKTADPLEVDPGEIFSYIVTVTNEGPDDAEILTLGDEGYFFEPLAVSPDNCLIEDTYPVGGRKVVCMVGALPAGESFDVTITARAGHHWGNAINEAVVAAVTCDPDLENNDIEVAAPEVGCRDSDGDGIADLVDGDPDNPSRSVRDRREGLAQSYVVGEIVDPADNDIRVCPTSGGIRFEVMDGTRPARINVLGVDLDIDPDTIFDAAFGSLIARVVQGQLPMKFWASRRPVTTTLYEGDELRVDPTKLEFTAGPETTVALEIGYDGTTLILQPNESVTLCPEGCNGGRRPWHRERGSRGRRGGGVR